MITLYEKILSARERKHAYYTYDIELTPLTDAGKVLFGRMDLLKEERDEQVKNWLKNALSRNKRNFKPNDKYTFYYDDPNESEDQRVNEVLRYVENKIYRKWETSTKWGNLKTPVLGVDYSVKIEKRVDVLDVPKKSGKQKVLKNPAIEVEGKEVNET
ncbi:MULTISPECIES: hypothetical protein [Bacillus cereus group]|uniref:hypothetical protein n=1 Tax=Bacillus cereus group TaxID=86661 RepID=UPI000BF77A4E|nr:MULTISPECIES: hypothetical protein [Bacillus cereus group]MDX6045516.1 hypothetical protein [Bacillus paranthracis]PFL36335.1 hypothetical protein COJ06_17885 [Bacillus cereus]PGQ68226.1 hypothetical protein COA27_23400 [Bacillus cereus]